MDNVCFLYMPCADWDATMHVTLGASRWAPTTEGRICESTVTAQRSRAITPQGLEPALTFLVTALVATSTTEMSFEGPLAE